MILCKRCGVQAANYQCAGMLMCQACAKTMEWRFNAPITVVGVDATPSATDPPQAQTVSVTDVIDPYALGQQAGTAVEQTGPYGLGQKAGAAAAKAAPDLSTAAGAVANTATTVRYAIIAAGVVGVGALLYIFYNAQKTSARAMDVIERHPDLLVKSGVLV